MKAIQTLDSGYMYNLGLSQDRALSVVEYCLSDSSLSKEQKEQLRSVITANGRSFSNPVYDADGKVDLEKPDVWRSNSDSKMKK